MAIHTAIYIYQYMYISNVPKSQLINLKTYAHTKMDCSKLHASNYMYRVLTKAWQLFKYLEVLETNNAVITTQ